MAGGSCMAGRGVCMVGGMRDMHATSPPPPGRYYGLRSMSGRYASYWNAFLFIFYLISKLLDIQLHFTYFISI